MILDLLRQWAASRHSYPWDSWCYAVVRSGAIFIRPGLTRRLLRLLAYREHLREVARAELFHYQSHRHYLAKPLTRWQRSWHAWHHYSFDQNCFGEHYRQQIYRGPGIVLWSKVVEGQQFTMRLSLGCRRYPEGDLVVALDIDGQRLHTMGFSWLSADGGTGAESACTVPFVARSQGRSRPDTGALATFERAFPQNAPSYFCYSAMQGIARSIQAPVILAVRSRSQICCDPGQALSFGNAYDGFWQKLGGRDTHQLGYSIPVPFTMKPLHEISAKHRRRAAIRRGNWAEIERSTLTAMQAMFSPAHRDEPAFRPMAAALD